MTSSSSSRVLSVDVFRGATVAAMLLVNDPGSWGAIYAPLRHAEWNGWTPTDWVFPFFLFVVGITTQISLDSRSARGESRAALVRQILRRAGIIFALGLLLNWFPFFYWGKIPGIAAPTFLDRVVYWPAHVRIPGVLQRIGIAYGVSALISLWTSRRQQVVLILVILLGYWALLATNGGWANPGTTLAARVDRALLNWGAWGNHLWNQTVTWDPEGPLSTLPAIATALLGIQSVRWLRSPRTLLFVGIIATVIGLVWNPLFPINKNLWTSSYVVFTAGLAAVFLALTQWAARTRPLQGHDTAFPPASMAVVGKPGWTIPFLVFGMNPILAFVGAEASARLIYSVTNIENTVYHMAYISWLPPKMASLAFAITFVLVWLVILTPLYRRRIFLKV